MTILLRDVSYMVIAKEQVGPFLSVFIIIFQLSTMNLLPGTKNSHSLLWEHFP